MARAPGTVTIARRLSRAVDALDFAPPVTHVYNPLGYAWEPHRRYLERYGRGPREVILVGMNPGPFGMAQTGVPFGEIATVRDSQLFFPDQRFLGCRVQLVYLGAQFSFRFRRHPVDEQHPVQVIHFMLDRTGQQASGAE